MCDDSWVWPQCWALLAFHGACWAFWGDKTDDPRRFPYNLCSPCQEMKAAKRTKSLAVSNFSPEQLDCILADPEPRRWAMGPLQNSMFLSLITIKIGCSWTEQVWFSWCWLLYRAVGVGSQGCHKTCPESAAIFSKEAWQWVPNEPWASVSDVWRCSIWILPVSLLFKSGYLHFQGLGTEAARPAPVLGRSVRVMAKEGSNSKLDLAQSPKRCPQVSWTMNMGGDWQQLIKPLGLLSRCWDYA